MFALNGLLLCRPSVVSAVTFRAEIIQCAQSHSNPTIGLVLLVLDSFIKSRSYSKQQQQWKVDNELCPKSRFLQIGFGRAIVDLSLPSLGMWPRTRIPRNLLDLHWAVVLKHSFANKFPPSFIEMLIWVGFQIMVYKYFLCCHLNIIIIQFSLVLSCLSMFCSSWTWIHLNCLCWVVSSKWNCSSISLYYTHSWFTRTAPTCRPTRSPYTRLRLWRRHESNAIMLIIIIHHRGFTVCSARFDSVLFIGD